MSALLVVSPASHALAAPGTIGLVVTSLRTAGVETPYLDECPAGVAQGNDEIWWKSLSPRDRDRLTDSGAKEPSSRRQVATVRGPEGEDVCWNPTVVRDPPQRIVEGKYSVGFNLDGTADGAATAKTCAHAKFMSQDGTTHIDNQMRRVTGCIHGWRAQGYIEMTSDTERRNSSLGVMLLHIEGVTDAANSPDVTVKIFRSADVMPKDAAGHILPFASYRIDGNPMYGTAIKGRIQNGVLTTDPIDVHIPFYGNRVETEFFIRDFRLELKLTENGASGLIGGYHDLANWWDYTRKMGYLVETAQFSCPALYAAARELADGFPDANGDCTALSTAYTVEAVRAFVNETPKPIVLPPSAAVRIASAEHLPPPVKVAQVGMGAILVTTGGKTLYIRSSDAPCPDNCLKTFEPLRASWRAGTVADWDISNGHQWQYVGAPVFTCDRDFILGDMNCAADGWQPLVVDAPVSVPKDLTIKPSEVGPVLANSSGHTLYRFIGNMTDFKREICNDACMAAQWHYARASGSAEATPPFALETREGQNIWMFKQGPLYTFAGDAQPGQIAGHRFGGASVSTKNWFSALTLADAIASDEAPPKPTAQKDAPP